MNMLAVGEYPSDLIVDLTNKKFIYEPNSQRAIKSIKDYPFDIIVTGLHIGIPDGFSILSATNKYNPNAIKIVTSADKNPTTIMRCYKLGAKSFLDEPFKSEELMLEISSLLEDKKGIQQNQINDKELFYDEIDSNIFVGNSIFSEHLKNTISQISYTSSTILITGESGTGKGLVARLIHMHSSQKNNPFITLNCAAIPESLIESELFGYEKGAFTGAYSQKKGIFEHAESGTLLLDEIGEISPYVQVKLLEAIEDKVIRRIGGNRNIPVNIRFISATNKDLSNSVMNKEFRQDLYYRLNIINIYIPPLRERITDLPVIADYLLRKLNKELLRNIKGFSNQAMKKLAKYHWPGNVRELRNIIERVVTFCKRDYIDATDIDLSFSPDINPEKNFLKEIDVSSYYKKNSDNIQDLSNKGLKHILNDLEKRIIIDTLNKLNYDKPKVAEYLKVKRTTLIEKIKRYGIQ